MSAPILIVLGTLLLLVIALVLFAVVVVRAVLGARRRRRDKVHLPEDETGRETRPDDTNQGQPAPALVQEPSVAPTQTPLISDVWRPPAEPARIEDLESATLAGRIAAYAPALDAVNPQPADVPHAAWTVQQGVVEIAPTSLSIAPEPPQVVSRAELDAELAGLLPQPPPAPVASEFPLVAYSDSEFNSDAVAVPVVEQWSVPWGSLGLEPVPEVQVEVAPTQLTPGPPPEPPEKTVFWAGPFPRHESGARAVIPAAPAEPRPEVRVTATEPEAVSAAVESAPGPESLSARPRVRVHVSTADHRETIGVRSLEVGMAPVSMAGTPERRLINPRLELAAPVEMWFGEARVGVKAGTATHDRFRKYADVLLAELRNSRDLTP